MSSNAVNGPDASGREYPQRPIIAVGGVVIQGARVLLIRRGQPPLEGRWSIPGGILEIGETITAAIERELKEETGVSVRVLGLLEIYEKVLRDSDNRAQYHFVILDYMCEFVEGTAEAAGDVTDTAWVAEEGLEKLQLTSAALRVVKKAFALAARRTAAGG
ncbi:MAG TPA: NUDIX hydrolase [Verrucomicrobiae bacterium]|nr:NUDIX hydrolase [Verrucomicrobiae bacterium]